MQQRPKRVGDTVEDIRPRDEAVTAHTVAAVDDDGERAGVTSRQSCDTEHAPADASSPPAARPADEGPVRRPLIRATLQLPEGTPATPRQPPVFTMHERQLSGQTRGKPGRDFSGNGRPQEKDGNTVRKKGRRSGHARALKDGSPTGGQSGNTWRPGEQGRPDGRPGGRPRSASGRRGRGRSR
ncbi:MAG: hypothetical protein OXH04_10100 [Acidobacteria bacterium]|nr:hypothetical protein [Acidobacteriota bacterium]